MRASPVLLRSATKSQRPFNLRAFFQVGLKKILHWKHKIFRQKQQIFQEAEPGIQRRTENRRKHWLREPHPEREYNPQRNAYDPRRKGTWLKAAVSQWLLWASGPFPSRMECPFWIFCWYPVLHAKYVGCKGDVLLVPGPLDGEELTRDLMETTRPQTLNLML